MLNLITRPKYKHGMFSLGHMVYDAKYES